MAGNPLRVLFFLALTAGLLWAFCHLLLYGWRRRAPIPLLLLTAVNVVCGLANLLLGGAHLVAVLRRALAGQGFGGAEVFAYDFRFYSLLLVGLLILLPGFLCLRHARGLTQGEASAYRQARRATLWLLAVNLPLIPIQGFAVLLSAFAGANLLALLLSFRLYRAAGC